MPLHYATLLAMAPTVKHQTYDERDTIIYALGVGMGADHEDEKQLPFLWERNLRALPTSAATLAWTRFADLDLGADYAKIVHAEQRMVMHKPVPPTGSVYSHLSLLDVVDRGEGRGAMMYWERKLFEQSDDSLISTQILSILARGDGGFGGPERPLLQSHRIPERAPDMVCEMPVLARSALIYRLTGDLNPLHIDPVTAGKAGFSGPVLHGLATFGYVGHVLLQSILDYDESRLLELDGRFSAPVYPGERIDADLWFDDDIVSIRVRAPERNLVVFDNGRARISPRKTMKAI